MTPILVGLRSCHDRGPLPHVNTASPRSLRSSEQGPHGHARSRVVRDRCVAAVTRIERTRGTGRRCDAK